MMPSRLSAGLQIDSQTVEVARHHIPKPHRSIQVEQLRRPDKALHSTKQLVIYLGL